MRLIIKNTASDASHWVAQYIADRINEKAEKTSAPFVLGLCTGSTPLQVYSDFAMMVKTGQVSFRNVISFNMDEYVGLKNNHPASYHTFMHSNLFKMIDEPEENIHILNGTARDLKKECEDYEKAIVDAGGFDLFLGGIGEDGHIAFNEPYSSLNSRTRVVTLTDETRIVNSRFFGHEVNLVPKQALSVGVGTITDSKEVLLLITGTKKARALKEAVEGPVSHKCTASALQLHKNAIIACDESSVGELMVNTYKYFKALEAD